MTTMTTQVNLENVLYEQETAMGTILDIVHCVISSVVILCECYNSLCDKFSGYS